MLSDTICTALQLAEHWQDVAEDLGTGASTCRPGHGAYGCTEADLAEPTAGPAVRELMVFQVNRAQAWLDRGAPLVGTLRVRQAGHRGLRAGGRAAWPRSARSTTTCSAPPHGAQAATGDRTGQGIRDREVNTAAVELDEAYRECERIT